MKTASPSFLLFLSSFYPLIGAETLSLLRANQKNEIDLQEFPSSCMDVQVYIETDGTIDSDFNPKAKYQVDWEIVDDCVGSPPGFSYDGRGDGEWQECIPPSKYAFSLWDNEGTDARGHVEIIVDGVVVRSRYRTFTAWIDQVFGTCPEASEVARAIL